MVIWSGAVEVSLARILLYFQIGCGHSVTNQNQMNEVGQMPRAKNTKRTRRYNTSRVRQQKKLRSLGPVAMVWAIAKSMPRASRGEILQACDEAGINRLTAAGQVQQFLHMRDVMHEEQQSTARSTRRTNRAAARGRKQTHRAVRVYTEPEVVARRAGSKTTNRRTSDREVRA